MMKTREKSVHFDPIVKINGMHVLKYAYHAARIGNWQQVARDRLRFQRRIAETERIIGPKLIIFGEQLNATSHNL